MAKYDIEFGFEKNSIGAQLVVIIDNPNLDLTFDEFRPGVPFGTIPDFTSGPTPNGEYHLCVFVKAASPLLKDGKKLIFAGTKFYFEGNISPNYLNVYCVEKNAQGKSVEKSRKRTATTVGNGGGGPL